MAYAQRWPNKFRQQRDLALMHQTQVLNKIDYILRKAEESLELYNDPQGTNIKLLRVLLRKMKEAARDAREDVILATTELKEVAQEPTPLEDQVYLDRAVQKELGVFLDSFLTIAEMPDTSKDVLVEVLKLERKRLNGYAN